MRYASASAKESAFVSHLASETAKMSVTALAMASVSASEMRFLTETRSASGSPTVSEIGTVKGFHSCSHSVFGLNFETGYSTAFHWETASHLLFESHWESEYCSATQTGMGFPNYSTFLTSMLIACCFRSGTD